MMKRLFQTTDTATPSFYTYYETAPGQGALLLRDDQHGDTHYPPHPGRYTYLEAATSPEDATEKAEVWEDQR
jgi:hypothetical protein